MKAYHELVDLRENLRGKDMAALTDQELLTALLSYTEPTGARELAAKLLDTFGGISDVLLASDRSLGACGVSRHASSLLRMLLPAYGRAMLSEIPADTRFDTVEKLGDYFSRRFCGISVETVYMMLLREDYTLIDCRRVARGSVNSANLNTRALVETALFCGASFVALAHNHPGGSTVPSQCDITTTVNLKSAFETVGIQLLDHLVVAGDRYVPILLSSGELCRET